MLQITPTQGRTAGRRDEGRDRGSEERSSLGKGSATVGTLEASLGGNVPGQSLVAGMQGLVGLRGKVWPVTPEHEKTRESKGLQRRHCIAEETSDGLETWCCRERRGKQAKGKGSHAAFVI